MAEPSAVEEAEIQELSPIQKLVQRAFDHNATHSDPSPHSDVIRQPLEQPGLSVNRQFLPPGSVGLLSLRPSRIIQSQWMQQVTDSSQQASLTPMQLFEQLLPLNHIDPMLNAMILGVGPDSIEEIQSFSTLTSDGRTALPNLVVRTNIPLPIQELISAPGVDPTLVQKFHYGNATYVVNLRPRKVVGFLDEHTLLVSLTVEAMQAIIDQYERGEGETPFLKQLETVPDRMLVVAIDPKRIPSEMWDFVSAMMSAIPGMQPEFLPDGNVLANLNDRMLAASVTLDFDDANLLTLRCDMQDQATQVEMSRLLQEVQQKFLPGLAMLLKARLGPDSQASMDDFASTTRLQSEGTQARLVMGRSASFTQYASKISQYFGHHGPLAAKK